ncbi:MAG: thioredoxin family protein [Thermodesulfobacteriota bacterium]|nr:thioredoxin family protein [Thermodesulfobacteriota bacterium]
MSEINKIKIIYFYSEFNDISLKTRSVFKCFSNNNPSDSNIEIQMKNYDRETELRERYGVIGTPETLIFCNQKMVKRHLGEVTSAELEQLVITIEGRAFIANGMVI